MKRPEAVQQMGKRVALGIGLTAVALGVGGGAVGRATAHPSPSQPAPVEPPRGAPTVEPRAVRPAFISAVRRAPAKVGALGGVFAPPYGDGPIDYEVDVENPGTAPLATTLVVERLDAKEPLSVVARVPVDVAPGGKEKVSFTDTLGLRDGCTQTRNQLRLETGTSTRAMKVVPSCTFTTEVFDPSASASPERRAAERRGKVSYRGTQLVAPPACGAPLTVRTTLRNDAKERVSGVLRLDGPVEASRSFALRPGAEASVEVTVPAFPGHAASHTLRIDAPADVPVVQPGWVLRVRRACSLDVAFDAP